jgi:hypothetical protein
MAVRRSTPSTLSKSLPPGRAVLLICLVFVGVFLNVGMMKKLNPYQALQEAFDPIVEGNQPKERQSQLRDLSDNNLTSIPDGPTEIQPLNTTEATVSATATATVASHQQEAVLTGTTRPIDEQVLAREADLNNTSAIFAKEINLATANTETNGNAIDDSLFPRECTIHNTRRWLEGPRIGNADTNMTDDFVNSLVNVTQLIDRANAVTSTTVCHKDGTFRSPTPAATWDLTDEALLSEWQFRLTYLAIHYHMHKPALNELEARRSCGKALPTVSKMDFECKDAKFLVANVAASGLGASFRLGAVASLWMGIATDRVTVFVNHATVGPPFLQLPWPLASCERNDLQCFFLPATPCVLTLEDVQNATLLPEEHARDLRRGGEIHQKYQSQRILIVETRTNPPVGKYKIQEQVRNGLYKNAMELIEDIVDPARKTFLQAAAQRIKDLDSLEGSSPPKQMTGNFSEYSYSMKTTHFPHAFLLYTMRPNIHYQTLSNEIAALALPADLDPSMTIGLPVRGSDKCRSESICLKHELYMELMHWTHNLLFKNASQSAKIILTTEDEAILNASKAYQARDDFPFEFLTNDQDVLQGSGAPKNYNDKADQVMLTTIVAMKMQLHGRVVYGNCCSNFHLMLFDMLREGCGAHSSPILSCLQEHPDRRFNICCGWTKTDECDVTREAIRAAREAEELNQKKI